MQYKVRGSEIIEALNKEISTKTENIESNKTDENQETARVNIANLEDDINFAKFKINHIDPDNDYIVDEAELKKIYDLIKRGV